jgi:tRNA-splicing ligase RtcB
MTTREFGDVRLERVREFVWEMPREGDMRVPARVLASEALLEEIGGDKTLQQLRNATHLPGITGHAICMPDGHQGYGFPVGGVGATDAETGCISPGSVGYDINCLPGDTDVRLSFGRKLSLRALGERFEAERATVATGDELTTSDIRLFTESGPKPVFELETETGDRIEATADHAFETPDGLTRVEELTPGESVYVQPFDGLEHETPEEFTVLSSADFAGDDPRVRRVLKDSGLLPLRSTDESFSRLLKLVGFLLGDGSGGGSGQTWFHGEPEALSEIRDDIREIGVEPSKIHEHDRNRDTDGRSFAATDHGFKTTSKALCRVFEELGVPERPTVESGFTTPDYLDRLPDWQQALFYAAYFGAAMNAPTAQHDPSRYCPAVSQTRTVGTRDAGRAFLEDVAAFLDGVGIETNEVAAFETDSRTVRLRLEVANDAENLLTFFSRVGYRYHPGKQRRGMLAVQYLRARERANTRRERTAADGGHDVADATDRPVGRSGRRDRSGRPRPGDDDSGFEAFCETVDVRADGAIATEIQEIRDGGSKPVYDIGVTHDAHTFLANGFVVSNCGVRMMRTNLTYDDVQGREEDLVEALFANVPSGLGGGGIVESGVDTVEAVLSRGVDWALEEGWAVADDLEHCEDEGRRPDADPDAVSQKAKDRGKNQLGSLGSGNHFLEVQRVTDVYREDVADAYGLTPEQIVVLIHCGSRGLGHQTCTDYLRRIETDHGDLLAQLPDKELAAAPAGSDLAEAYYGAMCACINFAWVNRQLIMHRVRQVFERVFDRSWESMEMHLLYDVAHNIAKRERHRVAGGERELYVHRKGATRAFPAGHPDVPAAYRDVGQPIIIPGSMGAGSYVLRGGEASMDLTFGSTAHGAGRSMSRTQAKREFWGETVRDELREQNRVYVKAQSGATVAEEAPGVYKDVDEVVRVSDALGIGDTVARTYPVCNVKG